MSFSMLSNLFSQNYFILSMLIEFDVLVTTVVGVFGFDLIHLAFEFELLLEFDCIVMTDMVFWFNTFSI